MKPTKTIVIRVMTMVLMLSMIMIHTEKVEAASAPTISLKTMSLQEGKTATLKLSGGKGKTIWKSSNAKVATVSKKGKVTAKKAGTATITATNSKQKLKCTVTVANKSTKTLIVYFSKTNTTKAAANKVKAATGGDIVRIQPKKAYPSNYDKLTKTAKNEYKNKTNPKRATKIYNMKQYDTIYVGFPVWWDNCPRLVQAFLKDYNLKGKTVVPFCTSGGSGIEGSMKAVRSAAEGATVKNGRDLTDDSKATVKKWIERLNIISDPQPVTEPEKETHKILVAYFSVTGTTRPYAQKIAEKLNGDLFEIVPKTPYTSEDIDYNSDCRANREQNDPMARPAISTSVTDMAGYDTIFLGYPIWWGTCPKIIETFMESYDFTGKTVIPFCTSGSSGIAASEAHIKSVLGNATVKNGHRISGNSDLETWLAGLSF